MKSELISSILLVAEVFVFSTIPAASSKNEICGSKPADVVFVLDSSGSIWELDFRRQIQFVVDVVAQFPVGKDTIRVGAVSFSNWAQLEFHLRDFEDESQIEAALRSMVQMRGDTNTASALTFVQDVMLTSEYGARPEVPHVIVVLTDGKSNDPKQTALQAARAKQRPDVHIFAIGVGDHVDHHELVNIASQPADQYVFTVKNYEALNSIKDLLTIKTCQVTNQPTPSSTADPLVQVDQACGLGVAADVLFAGSPFADENATSKTILFFEDIASRLDIGHDKVRVGLVPKDCDATPEISLHHQFKKRALRRLIKRSIPSTTSVLRYINNNGYSPSLGGRQQARRISLIVIDGPVDKMKQATREAMRARNKENIEVFVVGVGKEVLGGDLKAIASTPADDHVFHVTDYDDLPSILESVTRGICPVSSL